MSKRYAKRLRVWCTGEDLERWKAAYRRSGARNFSEWIRWLMDKEAALVDAAARNPWVDRGTGRARQQQLGLGAKRKQAVLRQSDLTAESEGL